MGKEREWDGPEKKERWPATVSVGLILINKDGLGYEQLVLVRQKETKKWTLISCGVGQETWENATLREFYEETGIDPKYLLISHNEPIVKLIPRTNKTSVAIYPKCYLRIRVPHDGFAVDNEETEWVKPFGQKEIIGLIDDEQIDRPEFNIPGIEKYLELEVPVGA